MPYRFKSGHGRQPEIWTIDHQLVAKDGRAVFTIADVTRVDWSDLRTDREMAAVLSVHTIRGTTTIRCDMPRRTEHRDEFFRLAGALFGELERTRPEVPVRLRGGRLAQLGYLLLGLSIVAAGFYWIGTALVGPGQSDDGITLTFGIAAVPAGILFLIPYLPGRNEPVSPTTARELVAATV